MYKLHIFDVDGTILDSMPMWLSFGEIYLEGKGVETDDDLYARIETLTMDQAAEYFKDEYGLKESLAEIRQEMSEVVIDQYANHVEANESVVRLIEKLHDEQAKLIILSSSDASAIEFALKRLGIFDAFEAIYSADQFDMGKDRPELFKKVCEIHGVEPGEAVLYDDAEFALEGARRAGCAAIFAGDIIKNSTAGYDLPDM